MNKLPTEFLRQGLILAKDANIFGIPLSELNYDELLATCAYGWNSYNEKLSDNLHLIECLKIQ